MNAAGNPEVWIMTCRQKVITRVKIGKKKSAHVLIKCHQSCARKDCLKTWRSFGDGYLLGQDGWCCRAWPNLALHLHQPHQPLEPSACSTPGAHRAPSTCTDITHKKFKTMHKRWQLFFFQLVYFYTETAWIWGDTTSTSCQSII